MCNFTIKFEPVPKNPENMYTWAFYMRRRNKPEDARHSYSQLLRPVSNLARFETVFHYPALRHTEWILEVLASLARFVNFSYPNNLWFSTIGDIWWLMGNRTAFSRGWPKNSSWFPGQNLALYLASSPQFAQAYISFLSAHYSLRFHWS